jgi:UDP-3-O-[3-hydroxymyristoyl] glucosamine N-acyltransferase
MQINLTLAEIAKIIGAECSGDSFFIKNIASLQNARESDLAIIIDRGEQSVFGQISSDEVKKSGASVILANKEVVEGKKYLLVQDTLTAFTKLADYVEKQKLSQYVAPEIHQTAIVGNSAVIEGGVVVGANSMISEQVYIGRNVTIGANVKIYPGAKVLDDCIVGDNTIIHSGAVVGSDGFGYSVTKTGLRKIPQVGIVRIGTHAEIGANCCIDRAAFDQTIIGNGVKLDNMVHIAHNVVIGDCTAILAHTGIAGGVQIGVGCQIGGQVAIKDHIKVGNGVKIVSKSGVMNNLPDGTTVCGTPAVSFNNWKRTKVVETKLPEIYKEFIKLKKLFDGKKVGFWRRLFGV